MGKESFHDSNVYPTKALIRQELGPAFDAYEACLSRIEKDYPAITLSFHYYNDTKSWLGKAETKKKTVFWLSFWPGYFKLSFFFNHTNIARLPKDIQTLILEAHRVKKNPPIILDVSHLSQLETLFKVIQEKVILL